MKLLWATLAPSAMVPRDLVQGKAWIKAQRSAEHLFLNEHLWTDLSTAPYLCLLRSRYQTFYLITLIQ